MLKWSNKGRCFVTADAAPVARGKASLGEYVDTFEAH